MKCTGCRTENPETNRFCRECGAKLSRTCDQCGAECLFEDKFCGNCGHHLATDEETPPIDYDQPRSYTPKFLAEKILTSRSAIEGERKLVTVMFADVAGFTPMSEKLDPEDVHEILDGCFRILMDEIHRFEGTVNEFRGDGLMALFGAPVAHEDHAQRACHAALAAQKALLPYAEKLHKQYGIDFKMRIGLNSGPVVVGSIGDDLRMDYTAQGDTANLAARMESNAEPGSVLVSKHTYWPTRDFFQFEFLGPLAVKGKEEPVKAYRLLKVGDVETRIEAAAGRGFTRFVGRKRELESLADAFKQVKSGHGQVVGIVGEAGVGKSRILHEFRNYLPQGQYTYLEGRCLHYGGSMPYLPILDFFRSFAGIKEGDAETVIKGKMEEKIIRLDEDLRRIIAPFQDLLSLKAEDEEYVKLEPGQKKERIFEAIRDLFVRGSQNVPIVLAIEDLHWIDKTTEELLAYLIGAIPNTRIMLILLYRPEYTHAWGSKSYYTQVGVDQLSAITSAELVQAILEGGDVEPELRELILGRASGNPLFMEELTHSLLENGSIQKRNQQFILAREAAEIQVPDTIQGIIASRIDRLEETLKRLLQVASVIGREFFFRILQAITGMREDLKSHLLNLQGLEFIYEKRLFPELEYIFKHALTQEVAYNSLLLKRRKEIHEKIGEAMEGLFSDRLEEFYEMLAYHYSKSENKTKAYEYLKASATKAQRNDATFEAFRFFRMAYRVLEGQDDSEENLRRRVEILHFMLGPMMVVGYPEDSLQLLEAGAELSERIGDRRSLSVFYSRMGRYYGTRQGKPLLGIEYSERSFEEAEKIQDFELMIRTEFDLFPSCIVAGQLSKLADISAKTILLLEDNGKEHDSFASGWNVYSAAHGYYGWVMGWMGRFEEGKVILERGARFVTTEVNDKFGSGWMEFCSGWFFNIRGDGKNAIEHSRKAITLLEDTKAYIILHVAWFLLGWGYLLTKEFETSREFVEKGNEIQSDAGVSFWHSLRFLVTGMIDFESGDLEMARNSMKEAIGLSQTNNESTLAGYSTIWLGRIVGKSDLSGADNARQLVLEGIRKLEELSAKPWSTQGYLFLGEIYADRGQKEKALAKLKKAESMFQEMGMDYWLAKTQEVLARL